MKLIFLFLSQIICCGYSKVPSQWDGSFECPKHICLDLLIRNECQFYSQNLHLSGPKLSVHNLSISNKSFGHSGLWNSLIGFWGLCACSLFCTVVLSVLSSFAIISLKKRELVALLCALTVVWLLVLCVSSSQCHGLVCECDISWSYSLAFCKFDFNTEIVCLKLSA